MVEQSAVNRSVVGSSPTSGAILHFSDFISNGLIFLPLNLAFLHMFFTLSLGVGEWIRSTHESI